MLGERLGVQLFLFHDPDKFVALYDRVAGTGYQQHPFMRACWADLRDPVSCLVARRRGETVGLMASRVLYGGAPGDFLSDALARGLLFTQDEVFLSEAWLPEAGPLLPERGLVGYQGGGWVHPTMRATGLVGGLSRLCTLQMLKVAPALELGFGLEDARPAQAGVMSRRAAGSVRHKAPVYDGFFQDLGTNRQLYAIWNLKDDLRQVLKEDWLSSTGEHGLPWIRRVDEVAR